MEDSSKPEEPKKDQEQIQDHKERRFRRRFTFVTREFWKLLTLLPRLMWDGMMLIANLTDTTDVEGTIERIRDGIKIKGYNIWILGASAILASIGLDTNSSAIIIGAMLISPLMSPILGIGLAVGINDRPMLVNSIKNFLIAIGISLAVSSIYFAITPLGEVTEELSARTRPTALDIGVAFFGGIAGIVAGSRKDITNAIPGVAIATALMPPLCTAGYGLGRLDFEFFLGAFYLFFLNAVFISLSTFLIVRLLKFPLTKPGETPTGKFAGWIALFVILVSIPSGYLFYRLIQEQRRNDKVENFITENFENREGCRVLNYEDSYNWKDTLFTLRVTLAGDNHVPDDTLDTLSANLDIRYGIERTTLEVIQTNINPEMLEEEWDARAAEIRKEVYKIIGEKDQAMEKKQTEVDSLKQLVEIIRGDTLPFTPLQAELKALYPELERFAITRISPTDFDSVSQTMPAVLIEWNRRTRMASRQEYEKRMYGFLKHRLGVDTLVILNF